MTVIVSWPAKRLYDVVRAGNARATLVETAALLKLDVAAALDALAELHEKGIVPDRAMAAALRESP